MLIIKILVFCGGIALIYFTIMSAIRMLVLPRSDNVWLTRVVFISILWLFQLRIRLYRRRTYELRDRVMALFAPVSLLTMPIVWLILVWLGYTAVYWAIGIEPLYDALLLSGSSLLTLGFAPVRDVPTMLIAFSDATIGLGLVALLMAYMPTMYNAFSRREKLVAMLEVRAGAPPSAVTMIQRLHRNQGLDAFVKLWEQWEEWFVELEESHTSLGALNFFRSPRSQQSWVTAAGAMLDASAMMWSCVDYPRNIQAALCLRAGYSALRAIADFFSIPYHPDPQPDYPISIARAEFDEAWAELEAAGVPLVADKEAAWRDFAGWRVNYDTVLIDLARLTLAPYAPWSSDRSVPRGDSLSVVRQMAG